MSLPTGPFTIVLGTPTTLTPPSNAPWGCVVLSNLSAYLLSVQIGGQQQWLNPWTENIYAATSTHAPVVINATLPAGTSVASGASAQVQATWFDPSEQPQGSWPTSLTANALASTSAFAAPTTLLPLTQGVNPGKNVTGGSSVRTLIVNIAATNGNQITQLVVLGNTTGYLYYGGVPYLRALGSNNYIVIIPVAAAADQGFDFTWTVNGGTGSQTAELAVYGDTIEYPESTFYNGQLVTAATETAAAPYGPTALLSGPCRLLTASLEAISPGNTAVLSNGTGDNILRVDSTAGSVVPFTNSLTFPDNTILPQGESLLFQSAGTNGTFGQAAVTYAYP